jgi:hypothetical protein
MEQYGALPEEMSRAYLSQLVLALQELGEK